MKFYLAFFSSNQSVSHPGTFSRGIDQYISCLVSVAKFWTFFAALTKMFCGIQCGSVNLNQHLLFIFLPPCMIIHFLGSYYFCALRGSWEWDKENCNQWWLLLEICSVCMTAIWCLPQLFISLSFCLRLLQCWGPMQLNPNRRPHIPRRLCCTICITAIPRLHCYFCFLLARGFC